VINLLDAWSDRAYYRQQRRQWREAKSVDELGQCGAQWARGELGAHPGGYDVPDAETEPLLPVLARANAAGFFTYQSQPGGTFSEDEQLVETRAFVEGFLDRAKLHTFRAVMESAGMLVLDSLVHDEPLVRYSEWGEVGGRGKPRYDDSIRYVSGAASRAIADAADLVVIDVVWRREHALWDALDSWAASRGA
jgi:hypothetical protein